MNTSENHYWKQRSKQNWRTWVSFRRGAIAVQRKIALQQALFPDGLVWIHEMGYLDRQNKWLIEDLVAVFQEFAGKPMSLEKFFAKFGVPNTKSFEHLEATIARATPLYELCASVLNSAP